MLSINSLIAFDLKTIPRPMTSCVAICTSVGISTNLLFSYHWLRNNSKKLDFLFSYYKLSVFYVFECHVYINWTPTCPWKDLRIHYKLTMSRTFFATH